MIFGIIISIADLALIQDLASDFGGSIADMPIILWIIPIMGLALSVCGMVFAMLTKDHYH